MSTAAGAVDRWPFAPDRESDGSVLDRAASLIKLHNIRVERMREQIDVARRIEPAL